MPENSRNRHFRLLFPFREFPDFFLKGQQPVNLHERLFELIFPLLALLQFLQPDQDLLDQPAGQIRIIFQAFARVRPL